jgi:hypothetical protein
MRVLSATIGALLISVSHAALGQEQNIPQGEAPPAELRCEPRAGDLPQLRPAHMTEDGVAAQLPERPLAEHSEMRPKEMTADELVAQLPEAPLAGETNDLTAAELVAQLPEAPLVRETSVLTGAELVAQLPEAPLVRETSVLTGAALVAQLPEAPLVRETSDLTGAEVVAGLPEAPLADMPEEEKRSPEAMKAEMQQDQPGQTAMPGDPQWAAVNEHQLGTTVDIPRAVLSTPDGHAHKRVGRRYKSPDGRAKVAIWTQRNTRHDTPARYLHRTFNIPRATVDYERFTSDFAVISGLFGTRVYYIRCNLSPRSGSFHCFDLAYPVREKQAWDGVVTRMSRSLRPHDD